MALAFLRIPALLLCLLPALAATASPTSPLRFHRVLTERADDKTIASLLQDRRGFIWLGALNGGLLRYDGYRSVKYVHNPLDKTSLPSDRVSIVYEDKRGRIWVGTFDGLARFNPETNDFTRFPIGTLTGVPKIVRNIVSDGKDGFWLGTWAGLQHFDPDSGQYRQFVHDDKNPESIGTNGADAMALDKVGGLWLETWPRGLDYLAPDATSFRHFRVDSEQAPDTARNTVHALHMDRQQRLWIGTGSGVLRWREGTPWTARETLQTPSSRISNFHEDDEGAVYAGTWTMGMLRWDGKSGAMTRFFPQAGDPHSLHALGVASIMRDRVGTLWVGTFNSGAAAANLGTQGFTRYVMPAENSAEPQPNNTIQALAPAGDGKLWLGGLKGLTLYDPAAGATVRTDRGQPGKAGALADDRINGLYQQPGGPLWLATQAGLFRLDRKDGRFTQITSGAGQEAIVASVSPGRDGRLWIATDANTIDYDPKSGAMTRYGIDAGKAGKAGGRRVVGASVVLEDRRGRVWMASQWRRGLEMLDPQTGSFRFFEHVDSDPASLSDDAVSSLYEDSQGRVWAGTARGLNEIVTAAGGAVSFRPHEARTGRDRVFAMLEDGDGKLWLSTESSLIRYDPKSGQADEFTALDGLIDNFKVNAAFRDATGALYFGGASGVSMVRPGEVRVASVAPTVAITDISVFNRSLGLRPRDKGVELDGPVTAPRALRLPAGESVFSIEFAALHFTSPADNHYRYRLQGFDRDWVEADAAHRSATYTNLAPATYLFEVKASNNRGEWSAQPASLSVTVLPAYWQTWWFRLLAGALLASLLVTIYAVRVRALKHIQRRLKGLVAERTAELEASNARLAALSTTDGLTGVLNRRGFDDALSKAWARAARSGEALGLALIDVDHFKLYNDRYGHQEGDACLRAVAAALADKFRRVGDIVARYGGEEFVILLPGTDAENAMRLAGEANACVAELRIEHADSAHAVVTVSIGVISLVPGPGDGADKLVRLADEALYRAKQAGRHRSSLARVAAESVA